jgi:hypothetical protein
VPERRQCNLFSRNSVVIRRKPYASTGREEPGDPISNRGVDARRLARDGHDAQAVVVTQCSSPGDEGLKAIGVVGTAFERAEDLLASIEGQSGEGLIRHVDTDVHRQPVQIGLEQFVGVYPRHGGEEAGLQFLAEGLTEGLQFAIHVVPP